MYSKETQEQLERERRPLKQDPALHFFLFSLSRTVLLYGFIVLGFQSIPFIKPEICHPLPPTSVLLQILPIISSKSASLFFPPALPTPSSSLPSSFAYSCHSPLTHLLFSAFSLCQSILMRTSTMFFSKLKLDHSALQLKIFLWLPKHQSDHGPSVCHALSVSTSFHAILPMSFFFFFLSLKPRRQRPLHLFKSSSSFFAKTSAKISPPFYLNAVSFLHYFLS